MTELSRGAIIQFERKGYYKLDVEYKSEEGSRMVFFDIPSGKAWELRDKPARASKGPETFGIWE